MCELWQHNWVCCQALWKQVNPNMQKYIRKCPLIKESFFTKKDKIPKQKNTRVKKQNTSNKRRLTREGWWRRKDNRGRVDDRALVHFAHLFWVLSAFTLTDPAELSALKVPGWSTRNGKKKEV